MSGVPSTIDDTSIIGTPPPSITPPPSPVPYPFETWLGNLTGVWGFYPSANCIAITLAICTYTNTRVDEAITVSAYRNNITEFEDTTRHCRPGTTEPGTAEYWYPGTCPYDWTSYVTETLIPTANPAGAGPEVTSTFQDAMCCPESYTSLLLGSRYFCTRLFAGNSDYLVNTWHISLDKSYLDAGSDTIDVVLTSFSEFDSINWAYATLSANTTLTYWPVFVRHPNPTATFMPTQTGAGVQQQPLPPARNDAEERKTLILGTSIPIGIIVLLLIAWQFVHWRNAQKAKVWARRKARGPGAVDGGEEGRDGEALMAGGGKPELMGSVYVGPPVRREDGEGGKPELHGDAKMDPGAGATITSLEECKYDAVAVGDGERELDGQGGRRGFADAELDGEELARRAAELDAARTQTRRISRKAVPGLQVSQQYSPSPEVSPHSPILTGPMPDFTTLYPSSSNPEAEEEERKLEYQEQRLRERREQLAREEEALRKKRAERGSGV